MPAQHPLTRRHLIPCSATLSSSPSSLLLHHLIWFLWPALRNSEAAKKCGVFWQEATWRRQPVLYFPVKSCLPCQAKGCQAPCYYSVNHKNNSKNFREENLHRATLQPRSRCTGINSCSIKVIRLINHLLRWREIWQKNPKTKRNKKTCGKVVTVAMPVFCCGPTPPSTALTIRMYSDLSSRSSSAVVVISPKKQRNHEKMKKKRNRKMLEVSEAYKEKKTWSQSRPYSECLMVWAHQMPSHVQFE